MCAHREMGRQDGQKGREMMERERKGREGRAERGGVLRRLLLWSGIAIATLRTAAGKAFFTKSLKA